MFPQLFIWAEVTCEVLTTLLARGSLCGWTRKAYAYKFRQLLALTLKSGVLASLSGN